MSKRRPFAPEFKGSVVLELLNRAAIAYTAAPFGRLATRREI